VQGIAQALASQCPELVFAVGVGSRFSSNPGIEHWNTLMHLLRYTLDLGITYCGPGRLATPITDTLFSFTDADWAGDKDKLRSTSGTVVILAEGTVSWISRLQSVAAQSTMEAK
jgi:hypothetical protein